MTARLIKLRDLAKINPRLESRPNPQETVSFLGMKDVSERGTTSTGEPRTFSEVSKGYTQFVNKDILVAKITPCFENGKIAQALISRPHGAGSTEFHVIRPDLLAVDARYLLHFLRQPRIRTEGERRMTGSGGQRRVPETYLAALPIALPALKEQRRIAEALDLVDELRAKRREAITLLDDFAQSLFLDMFGDPKFNPKEWKTTTFEQLVSEFRYGTSNKSTSSGIPALRIPNVVAGDLNITDLKTVPVTPVELDRLRLKDGDLLFVRTNGNPDYVGRCAIFTEQSVLNSGFSASDFIYASYLIRARLNQEGANPVYIREFMLGRFARSQMREYSKTSAGQFNINIQGLGAIRLPIPPLDKQREFEGSIAKLNTVRGIHKAHLAELDGLFGSVRQRAFRGDLWDR